MFGADRSSQMTSAQQNNKNQKRLKGHSQRHFRFTFAQRFSKQTPKRLVFLLLLAGIYAFDNDNKKHALYVAIYLNFCFIFHPFTHHAFFVFFSRFFVFVSETIVFMSIFTTLSISLNSLLQEFFLFVYYFDSFSKNKDWQDRKLQFPQSPSLPLSM